MSDLNPAYGDLMYQSTFDPQNGNVYTTLRPADLVHTNGAPVDRPAQSMPTLPYCPAPVYMISNRTTAADQQHWVGVQQHQVQQQWTPAAAAAIQAFMNHQMQQSHPASVVDNNSGHGHHQQQMALLDSSIIGNPQQKVLSGFYPHLTASVAPPQKASTPVDVNSKRAHESGTLDDSHSPESGTASRQTVLKAAQPPQSASKRQRVNQSISNGNHRQTNVHEKNYHQQHPGYTAAPTTLHRQTGQQRLEISEEARRFAQTRYPFSPFVINLKTEVRDKMVVEHLVNHAKNKHQFDLQIAGYRRSESNCAKGEYNILLFVKTSESFAFLLEDKVWPSALAGKDFFLKTKPSIPPQLSAVLPRVRLDTNMDEFAEAVMREHKDIIGVIRLRNRAQKEIPAVKLEFKSASTQQEMVGKGTLLVEGMTYDVIEYLAQARVLICTQCMGIGHFRKNCPQQDGITCRVCGEKCPDMGQHECSGNPRCVHCGDAHNSNDSKCRVVKDYRAALTRDLLPKAPVVRETLSGPNQQEFNNRYTDLGEFPPMMNPLQKQQRNETVSTSIEQTNNIVTKLDQILTEIQTIKAKTDYLDNYIQNKMVEDTKTATQIESLEKKTKETTEQWVEFKSTAGPALLLIINLLLSMVTTSTSDMGNSFATLTSHHNALGALLKNTNEISSHQI